MYLKAVPVNRIQKTLLEPTLNIERNFLNSRCRQLNQRHAAWFLPKMLTVDFCCSSRQQFLLSGLHKTPTSARRRSQFYAIATIILTRMKERNWNELFCSRIMGRPRQIPLHMTHLSFMRGLCPRSKWRCQPPCYSHCGIYHTEGLAHPTRFSVYFYKLNVDDVHK